MSATVQRPRSSRQPRRRPGSAPRPRRSGGAEQPRYSLTDPRRIVQITGDERAERCVMFPPPAAARVDDTLLWTPSRLLDEQD